MRSSRVAYPLLFSLLFFLCVGLAAATDAPPLNRLRAVSAALPSPTPTVPPPAALPVAPPPTLPPIPTAAPTQAPLPTAIPFPSVTPSPAPTGRFAPLPGRQETSCEHTAIYGSVHDGLTTLEGLRVRVWTVGESTPRLSAPTGSLLGPGEYEVRLAAGAVAGRWLVALVDEQGEPLSEPLVVETSGACEPESGGVQRLRVDFARMEGSLGQAGPTLTPVQPIIVEAPATPVPLPEATPAPPPPTPLPQPGWDGVERSLKVPILMYHYVSAAPPGSDRVRRDLSVAPELFRAQLITLREQGYQSVTLFQLMLALQQGAPLPEKPIVLTFDDGYRDNYTNAFAIMREEGIVGTFFVVTKAVEERNNDYMTWEMLVEMKEAGMEIASHTVHHAELPGKSSETIWQELVISKTMLEQRLGQPVHTFAYPYGRVDPGVIHLTYEAGYSAAVSTKQGVTHTTGNLMTLRRVRVRGGTFPPTLMETLRYWMVEASREP